MKNVDAQIDEAALNRVLESLSGKSLHELIANGVKKVGGAGSVPAAKGAQGKDAKGAEKKEEKKE